MKIKKKDLFEKSFQFSPDGIIICDRTGKILLINTKALEQFGYEREELIETNFNVLIPDNLKIRHNVHFENYSENPMSRQMSDQVRLQGKKKNGDLFFISISLNHFKNESGEYYFMAAVRDITDYIEKSEYLKVTLDRLQEAMKISKMGNWELDFNTNKLTWSSEVFEIFELDPATYIPTEEKFIELVYIEDREFAKQSFKNSFDNAIPYNIVHRYITPTGEMKYFRERGKKIYDENGIILKTLGTVQDITEVQKQKILLNDYVKKIEGKNKELEDYTYIAAHDLQEPINNIKGIITILFDEFEDPETTKEEIYHYFDLIKGAGDRLSNLIKALMETARLGQINPIETIDCNVILEEVLQNLQFQLKNLDAKVNIPKLPIINGFKFELSLLFQNLLSNALKYCKKDVLPLIKIDFHDQGPFWLFSIEDNGIGIEHKNKDKLFKMFRRLHTNKEIEGTGIGLTQCKKIVEQHNGEIWFESEFGKGTVFYFTLRKEF